MELIFLSLTIFILGISLGLLVFTTKVLDIFMKLSEINKEVQAKARVEQAQSDQDMYTPENTDKTVPLDEFKPTFSRPVTVKVEDEDQYTELNEDAKS